MEMKPEMFFDGNLAGEHAHEELGLRRGHLPGTCRPRRRARRPDPSAMCVFMLAGYVGLDGLRAARP